MLNADFPVAEQFANAIRDDIDSGLVTWTDLKVHRG